MHAFVPPLLMLLIVFGCHYVCIALHELGHLIAILCIGWTPLVFKLGLGPSITVARFGDLHVQLGRRPFSGWVRGTAESLSFFRFKWFVMVISGPLMTALAIFVMVRVLIHISDYPAAPSWQTTALLIAIMLQLMTLVGTLWPATQMMDGMALPTDGKQAVQSLTMSTAEIGGQFLLHAVTKATVLIERGESHRVSAILEKARLQTAVSSPEMGRLWIHCLLHRGKTEQADTAMNDLLANAAAVGETRAAVLDSLACLPLFHGHTQLIPKALTYIEEAIAAEPDAITLKGTKASLLIEAGELASGMKLLEEVMEHTESEYDRAICSHYLAVAHARSGDWKKGRELLDAAEKKYPACVVKDRARILFWGSR